MLSITFQIFHIVKNLKKKFLCFSNLWKKNSILFTPLKKKFLCFSCLWKQNFFAFHTSEKKFNVFHIQEERPFMAFTLFMSFQFDPIQKLFFALITLKKFLPVWVFNLILFENDFRQLSQEKKFLLSWVFNLVLFKNDLGHWSQEKRFSPADSLYDSSTRSY